MTRTDEQALLGAMVEAAARRNAPLSTEGVDLIGVCDASSAYAASALATASIATAALSLRALVDVETPARVDRRLASLWFMTSFRPDGWETPPIWDPMSGAYRARDGWIRLHCNAEAHRAAAARALGAPELGGHDAPGDDVRARVAALVAPWGAEDLETAVLSQGGAAARMRDVDEWKASEEGRAVAAEPLIAWETISRGAPVATPGDASKPLNGLKILDLTRVLAGPIATRLLAGLGASVLRVDPPGWTERAVAAETSLGKRCCWLDLGRAEDSALFERRLAEADVFIHGLRPGALDGLGYGDARRRALNPGLIEASLCAYGWSGPWARRRGFDSLVQMSSGIAAHGMRVSASDSPTPLPFQALDHATGYLIAAAALQALRVRAATGERLEARLSLARTAALLQTTARAATQGASLSAADGDFSEGAEATAWGRGRRLTPPFTVGSVTPRWRRGALGFGRDEPAWA